MVIASLEDAWRSLLPRMGTLRYANASTLNLPFILYCQQLERLLFCQITTQRE
ncbi:hypothetical protein [Nostoc sp. DedSLP04]|uniref:hypothetical protein n=1 Tax=Nostoc sp. DedSLP04 TaxID=3075401 RepID=UPI002AD50220|nr:hypothetical protein [Nostoc sp. DedSLP04]MDZ8030275.1 hypothetical protein [Nostoc sp. DedSLP04]